MAILQPTFYILAYGLLYIVVSIVLLLNHKNHIFLFLVFFPIAALYLLSTYFLLPLPLNMVGLTSVYHPKTSVNYIPFLLVKSQIYKLGILRWLCEILPLVSSAFLIGCSIPLLSKRKNKLIGMGYGILFFLPFLIFQIIIRLATGYEGRAIDSTDLCLYLIFQFFGFLLFLFIQKNFRAFCAAVHQPRENPPSD